MVNYLKYSVILDCDIFEITLLKILVSKFSMSSNSTFLFTEYRRKTSSAIKASLKVGLAELSSQRTSSSDESPPFPFRRL